MTAGGGPRLRLLQAGTQGSTCDSVENSFREKLTVQEKRQVREQKELEVFEILEDATLNSSFNSTSSRISGLVKGA